MKLFKDIKYFDGNLLDIYLPEVNGVDKTLIYIHGGGIESGDKTDIGSLAKIFTDNGFCFVSINYSLYPNTKFPKYIEESAIALKFIFDNAEKYNLSKKLYVSGSSAGAYILMMLMCNEVYLKNVGFDSNNIKGWISDDGQMTDHFNVQKYEKNMDPWIQRITEFAPIYYINSNTKFSRLLVIYYDNDMPMRKEQNLLFVSTLKHFNKEADIKVVELHGTHCQCTFTPEKDGSFRFITEVINWINN